MPPNPVRKPNRRTLLSSLKACALSKDAGRGLELHSDIARFFDILEDDFIGSSLVNMYSKCGLFSHAFEVLEKLPRRNTVTWNALIGGHVECEHGDDAVQCYERMQLDCVDPDDVTYVYLAKACRYVVVEKRREIHGEFARRGLLERNSLVVSNLIDSYAKLGCLVEAKELFETLLVRDVVCWTALMRGYSECGFTQAAITCFEHMKLEGVAPDAIAYVCILQASGSIGYIEKGEDLHKEIAAKGFLSGNPILGTALVDMYARCGYLWKAQDVFDNLLTRNVISWTSLIAGYSENNDGDKAIECFEQMQHDGIPPNTITYMSALKACCIIEAVDKGALIHANIEMKGFLKEDTALGNAIVDMYMKNGSIIEGQNVFDNLSSKNIVSWNTLIAGYVDHDQSKDALNHFERMPQLGFSPDAITYACGLKASGILQNLAVGHKMHSQILEKGLLERDSSLGSALVDMYAKCHSLLNAQTVFDRLTDRDTITWTTLIAGYAEAGESENALAYFEIMNHQGIAPNPITLGCGLRACSCTRATAKGQEIHAEIERYGLLKIDRTVANALIDMYAKNGWLVNAQEVFDKLEAQDTVSWNTLITGYTVNNCDEETLKHIDRMQSLGVLPDFVTFVCGLKACSCIGATQKGLEIHAEILKRGLLEQGHALGNSLIDMYSKCGFVTSANQVLMCFLFAM